MDFRRKTQDCGGKCVPLVVAKKLLLGLHVIQTGNMAKCIKHIGGKYNGKGPPEIGRGMTLI